MSDQDRLLFQHPLSGVPADGYFVAPTAIRLDRMDQLEREIFGPVLHVIRFGAAIVSGLAARWVFTRLPPIS